MWYVGRGCEGWGCACWSRKKRDHGDRSILACVAFIYLILKTSSRLKKKFLFMYLWLCWALLCGRFSCCGEQELLYCRARASHCRGFSCCGAWTTGHVGSVVELPGSRAQAQYCAQAFLLRSTWNLPGSGFKPMSLALARRFFSTDPPGESGLSFLEEWFSTSGDCASQETSGNVWRHFLGHFWQEGSAGTSWVKGRDVVKHPVRHRAAPITKTHLVQNNNKGWETPYRSSIPSSIKWEYLLHLFHLLVLRMQENAFHKWWLTSW